MTDNKENKTIEQRRAEKMAADNAAKKSQNGIRCYSGTGFLVPEKQPDGTIKEKFVYGREGD